MEVLIPYVIMGFGAAATYPFAKALMIYLAARLLKFERPSYWKALFCVLMGVGVWLAVSTLLAVIAASLETGTMSEELALIIGIEVLFSIVFVPIAEAISLYFFQKEPVGRTIGAVVLGQVFAVVATLLLLALFAGLMFLLGFLEV